MHNNNTAYNNVLKWLLAIKPKEQSQKVTGKEEDYVEL